MKKVTTLIAILLIAAALFAQEEVKMKDGKTILINSDGTWKYKLTTAGDAQQKMPNANDYIGTWTKEGKPNCKFLISKQGASFIINDNCGRASEAVYKLDDNGTLTGLQGIITISYDKESKKLMFNWPPITDFYIR